MAVYVEQAAQRIAGERNGDGPEDPGEQVDHAERLRGHHRDPRHGAGDRAQEGDKAADYDRARSEAGEVLARALELAPLEDAAVGTFEQRCAHEPTEEIADLAPDDGAQRRGGDHEPQLRMGRTGMADVAVGAGEDRQRLTGKDQAEHQPRLEEEDDSQANYPVDRQQVWSAQHAAYQVAGASAALRNAAMSILPIPSIAFIARSART